ncbi:PspC domain-containing protein, partial [Saccharomonospora iraqiensis]|uniref:PspC domain-containing protein n=1 Tax=Saccharomonospora iraqiensis TaxID=52698 RepID=UPI001F181299
MGSTANISGHRESFEDTVRDFWASRPHRPREGRKLAGVAAAVGDRYDIDPILVRVALIALTVFGGIGLSVYLLGWLLLPEADDEVSGLEHLLGKGHSSMSRPLALVLCVLLLPVTSWAFAGDWFDGGGFIGLALVVTAVYLLHRSRGEHNRPVASTPSARMHTAPTTPGHGAATASAATSSGTAQSGTAQSETAQSGT